MAEKLAQIVEDLTSLTLTEALELIAKAADEHIKISTKLQSWQKN